MHSFCSWFRFKAPGQNRPKYLLMTIAFLVPLLPAGCVVDTEMPIDAQLTCSDDSQCPAEWTCDATIRLCLAPGVEGELNPLQVKSAMCQAMHDKGQDCGTEIEALLGSEVAGRFAQSSEAFMQWCVNELYAAATEEQLQQMAENTPLIPIAPCSMFAEGMCEIFAAGFTTNCPQ